MFGGEASVLTQRIRAPNRKPHLVLARRTLVEPDVRFAIVRQRFGICGAHFFAATAKRQVTKINQAIMSRHGEHRHQVSLKGGIATHKIEFCSGLI
jgi:hypothetical protein